MRQKINRRFTGIALFSVVITTIVMTAVFYSQLKKQVFSDLAVVANLLIDEDFCERKIDSLRITLIDAEGKVLFDSTVDEQSLTNHLDRPEIVEAVSSGIGMGIRKSDTLSESVFYYAKKLDNGQILRVGREAHSVVAVLLSALPMVLSTALLLAAICLMVSHYLTSAIVKPIDEMAGDMEHIDEEKSYPELIPFTRKIRLQHEEILSAANIRQEFTANVSHELKTPLAAISGYAELMEAGLVDEKEIRRFSGEIRKSAARLLTLINDIIKLSQLDTGNAKDILDVVNLAEITKESVEMLSFGAAKNGIDVTYEGDDRADVHIGKELAQELTYNLIENAIRYNKPDGRVTVKVQKEGTQIILSVEDTGIGIPPEHQERIFERFYRVDKSRSKELGGTGLGLAIVKHICNLTDAEVNLMSKPGVGTKIFIVWDRGNA
ncbi:MAG: ATP-binding protein [Ruminococcus flavefaciens]|nr:ATP-binding protein [Ruminococcus flavefaciens]